MLYVKFGDKEYSAEEMKDFYLLRCKRCENGILMFPGADGQPARQKPKGLKVSNYRCARCGGSVGEAEMRQCFTCKRWRVVLKRWTAHKEVECDTCGDNQGFARIRFVGSDVVGSREWTLE